MIDFTHGVVTQCFCRTCGIKFILFGHDFLFVLIERSEARRHQVLDDRSFWRFVEAWWQLWRRWVCSERTKWIMFTEDAPRDRTSSAKSWSPARDNQLYTIEWLGSGQTRYSTGRASLFEFCKQCTAPSTCHTQNFLVRVVQRGVYLMHFLSVSSQKYFPSISHAMFCTLLGAPFIHSSCTRHFYFFFIVVSFTARPPLECLKILLSKFMTEMAEQYKDVARKLKQFEEQQAKNDDDRVMLIFDVPRAFFTQRKTNGLHRIPRGGQDRSRLSGVRATADDARHARCKRIVRRLLLRIVRHTNAKARLYSFCWFMEDQMKVKAWVRADDTCLRSLRKQCMLIKRRADFGWATKQTTLTSVRTAEWIGGGEQWSMLSFEPDPRHVHIALHDLGFDKNNAKPSHCGVPVRMMLSSHVEEHCDRCRGGVYFKRTQWITFNRTRRTKTWSPASHIDANLKFWPVDRFDGQQAVHMCSNSPSEDQWLADAQRWWAIRERMSQCWDYVELWQFNVQIDIG